MSEIIERTVQFFPAPELVPLFAIVAVAVFLGIVIIWYFIRESIRIQYRFLTVGSHKLRTPLSKIGVAISELIQKKEAADVRGDNYVVEEYDERMLRQIALEQQRLVGLVNLLLEVSESEIGHSKYEKNSFDLLELIQEILVGYQNGQWKNDRVFIELKSDEEKFILEADKRRIGSVIQVLLENAIIYSPAGGKITILLERHKNEVRFSIEDRGIGIEKGEKKRIFTKFYRSDKALRVDTEGTGVGLFLAKHIVEGHGGKIWFKSEGKEKGSTFYFSLPLKR